MDESAPGSANFWSDSDAELGPDISLLVCALVLAAAARGNHLGQCGRPRSAAARNLVAPSVDLSVGRGCSGLRVLGRNSSFDNNGYHCWRGTRIYRSKSALMSYSISQAINYTCFG